MILPDYVQTTLRHRLRKQVWIQIRVDGDVLVYIYIYIGDYWLNTLEPKLRKHALMFNTVLYLWITCIIYLIVNCWKRKGQFNHCMVSHLWYCTFVVNLPRSKATVSQNTALAGSKHVRNNIESYIHMYLPELCILYIWWFDSAYVSEQFFWKSDAYWVLIHFGYSDYYRCIVLLKQQYYQTFVCLFYLWK